MLQDYFVEINAILLVIFLLIYFWLISDLIKHMRTLVRLKYHSDERAEFDEGRVKFVLAAVFFIWLSYFVATAYSVFSLDTQNFDDFRIIIRLSAITTLSLAIGAYAIFFINNRVQGDIKNLKQSFPGLREDRSQDFTRHL